jgi:hypothetical protein
LPLGDGQRGDADDQTGQFDYSVEPMWMHGPSLEHDSTRRRWAPSERWTADRRERRFHDRPIRRARRRASYQMSRGRR